MKTLIMLPLRYLAGRRLRTALTTLAIILGVAVLFAVNALLPTMIAGIQSGLLGISGQVDLTISSTIGETFDMAAVDVARQTPGVAAATPALRRQFALPTGPNSATSLELVGVDLATVSLVRHYQLSEGRFLKEGETRAIVVAPSIALALGLKPGSTLALPTPQGLVEWQVAGITSVLATDQLILPLAAVQELFDTPGRINTIDLALAAGANADAVKDDLERRLGPQYRVGSVAFASDTFATLQLGVVMVNVLGLLTLFMGGFLIFNTFRTIVVERRHDIGLLRAVGATRRTIVALIVMESVLQGVIGTAFGLALGYLFAQAITAGLQSMLAQYMRVRIVGLLVTPESLLLSIGLGLGVTLVAGLLPALGASRVPVLEALRPQPPAPAAHRVSRGTLVGTALVALGALAILSGSTRAAGPGILLFLAGLVTLSPALVNPLAHLFEPLLRLAFAREGAVAAGNMQRQPGRAAVTASALMLGLAIIIAATGLFSSIMNTFYQFLDSGTASDIVLLPPNIGLWSSNVGAGPEFERELAQVPGIGDWAGVRYAGALVDGAAVQMLGLDPVAYPRLSTLTFDAGDHRAYAELAQGRTAIATPIFANARNLRIGDSVNVQTPDGVRAYRIVAVGTDYLAAKINTLYISQQNLAEDFHRREDIIVLANLAPGASREQVKADLEALLRRYPQFSLMWSAEWRAEQRRIMEQAFLGMYAVLIVLTIPSLLGLINTLAINVLERTREIGVLRAIGATRAQVRRMVLAESLLLGAAGAAFGMLAGLALGYAVTLLLAAAITSRFTYSFPLAGLIFAAAVALLLAVVASLLPARQAARLPIVRALQYE